MKSLAIIFAVLTLAGAAQAGDWKECIDTSRNVHETYNSWVDVIKNCPRYPAGLATRYEKLVNDWIGLCEHYCDGSDENQTKVRQSCQMYRESMYYSKSAYPCY